MTRDLSAWALFEKVTWEHILLLLLVLAAAKILASAVRMLLRRVAEAAPPHRRLSILRTIPVVRLLIGTAAVVAVIPILVEPTFRNVAAVVATVAIAIAFTLKDYASSVLAGLMAVLEKLYQPGDWIEIGGIYGEVKAIHLRTVCVVTADDNEITIPHLRIWSTPVSNATSGERTILCVTNFYIHPDHDASAVRERLASLVEVSPYWKVGTAVTVIVQELPWATQYRLKAYATESRDQFLFTSDLSIRGKESLRALNVRFAVTPYVADHR